MANDFLLIIDGSSLLSTQYYGNLPREILYAKNEEDKKRYYYKLMQTSKGQYTNGVYGFIKTLLTILKNQQPGYLAVCWDLTRDTFRREIYPEYKGTRKETPQPLKEQFALCQRILDRMGISQFMSEQYEADDYAGSLASRFETQVPVAIMTKDRDYLQLVDDRVALWMVTSSATKAADYYKRHRQLSCGYPFPESMLYLTEKTVEEEYGFPPEKTVMVKQLAGDTADNIPGVKGIGEKTAIALANAYDSIEDMYDEIRDLDKAGLDAVKNRWKEQCGIKRSPLKYLLANSEDELVGEKASQISRKLGMIKRDIDLSSVTLEDLQTKLNIEEVTKIFHELEFRSLSVQTLAEEFCVGTVSRQTLQMQAVVSDKELEKLEQQWIQESIIGISVLTAPKEETEEEEGKQLELFSYMQQAGSDKKETGDNLDGRHGEEILAVSVCIKDSEAYLIEASSVSEGALPILLNRIYDSQALVTTFDVKKQLWFIKPETVDALLMEEDKKGAFDLSVAAYLLNPLKNAYTAYDVCLDYYHEIANREELTGKQMSQEKWKDQKEIFSQLLAQEAEAAKILVERLTVQLQEQGMYELFWQIEMPTLFAIFEMEKNGVIVEREALRRYREQLKGSIEQLEQAIYKAAGHEFNIQSPKQLGVVLFEELGFPAKKKTKTGYSTSAEVLEELKQQAPIVNEILEYRQLTKLYSTYGEGLDHFIQKDGRIHGHFNQTVTATGRLSSTEPNLQNIPMRTELGRAIRKVFLPEKGSVFVDADYSQIELRVLAHMSGDDRLIQAFQNEEDIHALTASQVFHVPFAQVTPLMRRNAKAVNFGIVYGISAHGLSQDLGITRKEAADYMKGYFATYPKVKLYLDALVEDAKKNGEVKTMFGRIRPIPELHSTNFNQRNFGERVAMNSPIQGTAADIMKIAMVRTVRGLKKAGLKARLVLQIHDELVIETSNEEKDKVKQILYDAMTEACDMKVALAVDMHSGESWFDAK